MDTGSQLLAVLQRTSAVLHQAGVPFCLVGGLAVAIMAKPRATEDVDIALAADDAGRSRIAALLRAQFAVIQDTTVIHLPNATIWRVVVKPDPAVPEDAVVLDFLLADRPEVARAIERAVCVQVGAEQVPIARADDLIALKKLSGRPQDLLDIQSLHDAESGDARCYGQQLH